MSKNYGATIQVDNVNEALPLGLQLLHEGGYTTSSRGLEVVRFPGPVLTHYHSPERRVLFDSVRDANPFFHLIGDALWLLSGSNRVALPALFLPRYVDFSDNGRSLHAAYGARLRSTYLTADNRILDQITTAADLLAAKPDTRQCVLSIWDPELDLGTVSKDIPCNDTVMLDIVNGRLNMMVCNRSNDAIWGAYGANVVQFSVLQEVIATLAGVEVGIYTQMSNNFHAYTSNPFWQSYLAGDYDSGHVHNHYMDEQVQPWAMCTSRPEALNLIRDAEAMEFAACAEGLVGITKTDYHTSFFNAVVVPMTSAYRLYREGLYVEALDRLNTCAATDWRVACSEWILRRKERADQKQADLNRARSIVK